MIDPVRIVNHLEGLGIELFTGVPDSLLKPFCSCVMATLPRERHVIAANEGAAVGIAMGHYLRTQQPAVVYLQNSGFGNTVNPLLSLADPDVYGVPMLLIVGWRGQVGVKDEPQHKKQGRVMDKVLDALELPWAVLPKEDDLAAENCLKEAVEVARSTPGPFFVLVEKGTFSEVSTDTRDELDLPSREEALISLVEALGDETINVSTTGMLSRELFEHRERSGTDGSRDFLTVGGMGHCSSIALGIALRERDREVWCLDGDGALLMHLGTVPVIADHAPSNFFHVVFNNGVHDSVGGQPTSIDVMDIPEAVRAMGYRFVTATDDPASMSERVAELRTHGGPSLLEIRVRPGNREGIGRPTRTPEESKQAFMSALQ